MKWYLMKDIILGKVHISQCQFIGDISQDGCLAGN